MTSSPQQPRKGIIENKMRSSSTLGHWNFMQRFVNSLDYTTRRKNIPTMLLHDPYRLYIES